MSHGRFTLLKFGTFATVMAILTAALIAVFADYRGGTDARYSAVFTNVSDLKVGDSVRVAGVRAGTVDAVTLRPDKTVVVDFDADTAVTLTTGTRASVRYLNLVGDRYLELTQGPGSTQIMASGAQIPIERTSPALDLDVLLNGLKPVMQGLAPQDVNVLTTTLIEIMQGQGDNVHSLMARTASFTRTLADNGQVIESLIDNLNVAIGTVSQSGQQFGGALDRLRQLVGDLAADRDSIGAAIESLSNGTASVASLLGDVRPPLAATVDQLNRLAPALDSDKDLIDSALQKAPENYRKLARIGSYGSFFNYYLCGVTWRVSDLQGRTAVFPWIKQETGRCAENP
ncbi:MCE family protein [Mycolicibacterium setense]|uniref:MCE family protein n=1 Tax=Mycolicibacterium setense TaxID=431269 RepID=UPI0005755A12|nr:MCE family protein [Mycolicibacterium setense]KHO21234.1 mammalian cell entry protein [Mycolicibacterium setense]MCV7114740.1 MCE family protein [Mycolicibacterium setense]